MIKNYLLKSVKFIGKGVGLICLTTGCEYIKSDSNKDIRFIHSEECDKKTIWHVRMIMNNLLP